MPDGRIARKALADADIKKFEELVGIFKSQGQTYCFDWRMLMAKAYQESQFDQTKRGPRGAVGIYAGALLDGSFRNHRRHWDGSVCG